MDIWLTALFFAAFICLGIWIVSLQLATKESHPCDHDWLSNGDRIICIHCGHAEELKRRE